MDILAEKSTLKPKPKSVVLFRLFVQKIVVFWFYLLRSWAGSWQQPDLESFELAEDREKFRWKNEVFQEELSRIFAPYYCHCPDCLKEDCCRIYYRPEDPYLAPQDVVDYVIYGLPAGQITRTRKFTLGEVTQRIYGQLSSLDGPPDGRAEKGELRPCPELTDNGCRLPWGERRLTCVLALCDIFARYMTWRDYRHYLGVSLKYLTYLTLYLRNIKSQIKKAPIPICCDRLD